MFLTRPEHQPDLPTDGLESREAVLATGVEVQRREKCKERIARSIRSSFSTGLLIILALLMLGGVAGCGETKAEEESAARTVTQEEQQQQRQEAREEQEHKRQLQREEREERTQKTEPPSGEQPSESSGSSSGEKDEVGSSSHATDAQFCSQHECIGSFTTEGGTIVECADGSYSHAGGVSGACSHHGGEKE
jgi:hypothetical protein